jgi:CelD/BcsL family acetyltransferase involved in cellulose biosynthesis
MDTVIINSRKDLLKLKDDWEYLIDNMNNFEVFYSWDWIESYISRVLDENVNIAVIVIKDKGNCVAIAPLCIERKKIGIANFSILRSIVKETVDYRDFYLHKDYNNRKLLNKIFSVIKTQKNWDLFELKEFSSKTKSSYLINDILKNDFNMKCIVEHSVLSPFIDYNTLSSTYSKSRVKNIKRIEKKLSKNSEIEVKIGQKWDYSIWEIFIKYHKTKWKKSNLHQKKFISFYEEVLPKLALKNQLDFSYLKINQEVAAIHIGFLSNKKVAYYIPIVSGKEQHAGSGSILLMHLIEHYKNKCEEFDFLRGNESYKFDWTDNTRMNFNFYVFPENTNIKSLVLNLLVSIKIIFKNNKLIRKLMQK